jgi:hypothetical protein
MPSVRRRVGLAQAHPLDGRRRQPGSVRPAAGLAAVAVVAIIVGLAMGGFGPFGSGSGGGAGPGGSSGTGDGSGEPGGLPSRPPTPPPIPGHEVYGFVPYWEMDGDLAAHLANTDLTTLALFSVTHHSSGRIDDDQNGYKRITRGRGRTLISEARARGTRIELVYSSFGEDKNRAFYATDEAQARWISQLVAFTVEHGFDGINVDVEGLPGDLVPAYGAFVGRLREALRAKLPEGQVSVATQANQRGAMMAAVAASAGADRIFLMGYDYHWPGSQPGASAPIERNDGEERDLRWSLDTYASVGVPVDRTLLGLPLYGVMWPVSGPGLGAPSLGRGDSWVPRRNLATFERDSFDPLYDAIESVEFYAVPADGVDPDDPPSIDPNAAPEDAPWTAVYFDSPRSLTPKLLLADERGLAGAGFWAIGYERGLPGYRELIATFRAGELEPHAAD